MPLRRSVARVGDLVDAMATLYSKMDDSFDSANSGDVDRDLVVTVGDNIHLWRLRRGWSLGDLARSSGVSKSTLSTLESGEGNPGLETLLSVSRALGLPFSELITRSAPGVDVMRHGEAAAIVSAEGTFRGSLLTATGRRGTAELYLFDVDQGGAYTSGGHQSGVVETIVCLAGQIEVGPPDATVLLTPGDRGTFQADTPHVYRAAEPGTRVVMLLSHP